MAETATVRKRAVAAKTVAKKPATPARGARRAAPILEDDAPITNYALRLTDDTLIEDDDVWVPPVRPRAGARTSTAETSFEARMSEALRAISAAQGDATVKPEKQKFSPGGWLKALDKMPPIRLPIGPAVPWRVGLPAMIALIAVMFVVARPSSSLADAQGAKLPAQQDSYAVQQAPLFARTDTTEAAQPAQPAQAAPQPIGVPEPAGASFDFLDLGFKLVAVLALAYGSLVLLKRAGLGGNAAGAGGNAMHSMKVISSLALAPNRSVHVIRVPGGRTLLVGATPNAVNLLADLGELAEDETPEASSFLSVLKGKISD